MALLVGNVIQMLFDVATRRHEQPISAGTLMVVPVTNSARRFREGAGSAIR